MSATSMSDLTETINAAARPATDAIQGDLTLLNHPVAQQLLQSAIPARLAYVAPDRTPRVIPILFHWTGEEIVLTSWPDDPKVAALQQHSAVAITIDTAEAPYRVLSLRGMAAVSLVDGVAAECLPTFTRYMGPEQGRAWVEMMGRMTDRMARIVIRPTWVGVLDFETRFPSGMTRRMGNGTRATE
jgi:nitroimidazol reductase NimA-like FMN-containing flavoprotein (pyridoxamine 5'-phosphate oxidase superfamily)